MNLLTLLLGDMTSQSSLNSISEKTGVSSKALKKLLPILIPILIKHMTSNASSGNGATSLLSALTQHTSKKGMDQQLLEADEEDGNKIISHILGNDRKDVTSGVAAQTGLTNKQIAQVLSVIAPVLMSGVSDAADNLTLNPQGNIEPAAPAASPAPSLFSALLGGGKEEAQPAAPAASPAPSLFSALLGGKEETVNPASYDGTALLMALLGAKK